MGDTRLIVGGNFNAWNTEWGSHANNPRGELLSYFVDSLNLILANTGDTPMFIRGEATSMIDMTFSRGITIDEWTVVDEIDLSGYVYVAFSVDHPQVDLHLGWLDIDFAPSAHPDWVLKKIDLEAFHRYFSNMPIVSIRGEVEPAAHVASESLDSYITDSCNASMSLRTA